MINPNFRGLRVLTLESRFATEISKLIISHGGRPQVAPALREVTLESNSHALGFADGLLGQQFDMVIFLTGAGIRGLMRTIHEKYPYEILRDALARVQVVARGPKPAAALNEFGVKPNLIAPEPNTWREVLRAIDEVAERPPLKHRRIAVQEYGIPCMSLIAGLNERGASVTCVPVYRWSLPEELGPLQNAAGMIAAGNIDVLLLTAAVQAENLFQVAAAMGIEGPMREMLERVVIASVGPTTSEHLGTLGLRADLEASRPRMVQLVQEAAGHAAEILRKKHDDQGLEFLHDIGRRRTQSSSLGEVLNRVVGFATSVLNCDSCFVYLLEGNELVLRASKNPHPGEVNHLRLGLDEGITGWVATHGQPVAVPCSAFQDPRFQFFNELPEDQYESFLSVPIFCRDKLVGVINLQNRLPHAYTRRELRLLSTIGFFVGAEIEIARLEGISSRLSEELDTRKVVERAKGILQQQFQFSEEEAYFFLRRKSRQMRSSMRDIAQAIIDKRSHPTDDILL